MESPLPSATPHPRPRVIVNAFISSFTSRRSLLQAIRAVAIGIAASLCGICLVVAIDWAFAIDDAWRWMLTCTVYVGALALAWKQGLAQLFFPPPAGQVAWLIERSHPSLDEGLIACVELRQQDGSTRSGSANFLEEIERKVAHELSYLDTKTLLPWKQVYRFVFLAVGLLWVIFIACMVPNSGLGWRFAKAMIPLVSFEGSDGRDLNSAPEPPKVLAFHMEVTSPEYSGLTIQRTSSTRGDIQVLKGSRLKLLMDVNQPIALASMAIESKESGKKQIISLVQEQTTGSKSLNSDAVQRFAAEWVVEEDFLYDVRLVSESKNQGKSLENTYSPRYRVDALDDSAPSLTWETNAKTLWREPPKSSQTFLVANDAVLDLSIRVSDNLPVDLLVQEVSINREKWIPVQTSIVLTDWQNSEASERQSISSILNTTAHSNWKWDLRGLEVRSGDSIVTRVTATDRKGNVAYSPAIQLSLAAEGFERNRHAALIARSKLLPMLELISSASNQGREFLRPRLEQFKEPNLTEEDRIKSTEMIRSMLVSSFKACRALRSAAEPTIKQMQRCVDQAEMELVTRMVARIEKEWLTDMSYCLDSLEPTSEKELDPQTIEWVKKERQSKANRLLQSYDLACENARRTENVFRQLLGLELQTALTRDLTELRDYLASELSKNIGGSATELSRSCEVTIQYLNTIERLASEVEPSTTADLRNRLGELHQWIDQVRTESTEMVKQDASDERTRELKSRLERTVAELKRTRWVFHLQGGLVWDAINGRKDLSIRSGSLWPIFARFFERQAKLVETAKDRSLATDAMLMRTNSIIDEATGPIQAALSQMLDRRDIHQLRIFSDPHFASDMGMAYRAWTGLLERMASEPGNSGLHIGDAKAIAQAFRVLESAHETVEARLVVQSLMPIEQYEWKTLDAQLWTPKQWESVSIQLEVAQQWMREAGFPNAVADKYNALRYSDPAKQIASKIGPRRDANNATMVSVADEFRSLLLQWPEADLAAKPIVDDARATLARFAPSVSELAKQAAAATERVQRNAERIAPNKATATLDSTERARQPISSPEQLQNLRESSEKKLSQLQDALIELANKQDVLNHRELETARDSDRSLKMLETVLPAMNERLDELVAASNRSLQAGHESTRNAANAANAAEAAEATASTVQALEKIANHFSKLEESAATSERPQELQALSEELRSQAQQGIDANQAATEATSQRDESEDYQRAKDLAELAESDTEALLRKLESELQRNPPMQKELAEISKSNAQSLATELQIASETEVALATELENADAKLFGEKRLKLEQLRSTAEQSERLASRMLDNSQRAVQRTVAKDQAVLLEQATNGLRRDSQFARGLNDDTPRREVESASQQLAERIEQALKLTLSTSQAIQPTEKQSIHKDEQSRVNSRADAQNLQNQSRNELIQQSKEFVVHSQRQMDLANKRLQKAQTDLESANKDRKAAQAKNNKEPANEYQLNHLRRMTNSVEQAMVKQKWDEQIKSQAEAALGNAREQSNAMEQRERVDLDRPNPHAALAIEQLDKAQELLTQLNAQSRAIANSIQQLPQPQTPSATLNSETAKQQQIQESIGDISSDLSRSARHEDRLGNKLGAEKLSVQAESIGKLTSGSVGNAKKELDRNSKLTEQAEHQQADARKDEEINGPFTRADSQNSETGLTNAARELSAESKKVQDQTGQMQASQSPENNATAFPKSDAMLQGDGQQLEARDLARMLDLLDRQLNADSKGGDSPQPNAPTTASERDPKSSNTSSNSEIQTNQSSKSGQSQEDRNGSRSAFKDSVKSAAEKLAGLMGQGRLAQRSAAQARKNARSDSQANQSKGSRADRDLSNIEAGEDFVLPGMNRVQNRDWGKLRDQRTKDAVEGRRDELDPEFEEAIQAYYRALGNR